VRVESGAEQLSPMSKAENATLARVGAAAGERLACQALVSGGGVTVTRVLPPWVTP
jgi:ferredoxin